MTDISQSDAVDLEELTEAVSEVLDGMLEASLEGNLPEPVATQEGLVVSSSILITGDRHALLEVHTPGPLAYGLSAALIGEDPVELERRDVAGMIAELTNLMGGVVKSIIAEETYLEVPKSEVVAVEDLAPLSDGTAVFHDLGRFTVQLTLDPDVDGGEDRGGTEEGAVG